MKNNENRLNKLKKLFALTMLLAIVQGATPLLVQVENSSASSYECSDGIDNNLNGDIDYPDDSGCSSLTDNSEGDETVGIYTKISDGINEITQGGNLTYAIEMTSTYDTDQSVPVQFKIPVQVSISSSSNAGIQIGQYIKWNNVLVQPNSTKVLYVYGTVKKDANVDDLIIAEVIVDGKKNSDTTRVKKVITENKHPLEVEISDGKAFAEPNEKLTYRILVKNRLGEDKKYSLRTTISSQLNFITATGYPNEKNRIITWPETEIKTGEIHEYFMTLQIERDTADGIALQVRVSTSEGFAADTTSVKIGHLDTDFKVKVSDGYEAVKAGSIVRYAIFIENNTNELATEIDVNSALPTYSEFVSASEGGYWTGTNVRWTGLTISPYGNRTLFVDARVRSDAPLGSILNHKVEVRGNIASDASKVAQSSIGNGMIENENEPITLRKTADRQEVRPGDSMGYTIFLRNNTNHVFTNVTVQDRMDTRYMKILGSTYGTLNGDTLSWEIPALQPNEIWEVKYSVQIARNVPHGEVINNVVTVRGDGLETISLTERVTTGATNVITNLPPAGVGIGGIFVGITGFLGAMQAIMQKKKYFLL